MKLYEITYIANPALTPEEADSLQGRVTETITKAEGALGSSGSPQRKSLAYPVKKNNEAYLSSMEFSAEEDNVKKIEEEIKKEKDILRHLLVKKPEIKEAERRSERKKSLKPEETEKKKDHSPEETEKKKDYKPEKAKLQEIDKKIEEIT